MTRIDRLIAQSDTELRRARGESDPKRRDLHVIRSERLLDEAWRLNEADQTLPHLESGLWCAEGTKLREAA